jgi:hypothetical protein
VLSLYVGCGDAAGEVEDDQSADTGVPVTVRSAQDAGVRPVRMDAGTRTLDVARDGGAVPVADAPAADAPAADAPVVNMPARPVSNLGATVDLSPAPVAVAPVTPAPPPPAPVPPSPVPPSPVPVPPSPVPPSPVLGDAGSKPMPPAVPPVDASAPAPAQGNATVDASGPKPPKPAAVPNAGALGATAGCREGLYTGPLTGEVATAAGMASTVSGHVSWRLVLAADGKSAVLRDGQFEASGPAGTKVSGQATGTVDCSSGKLTQGAVYVATDNGEPLVLTGALTGMHVTEPGSLDGSWTVETPTVSARGGFRSALGN